MESSLIEVELLKQLEASQDHVATPTLESDTNTKIGQLPSSSGNDGWDVGD